MRLLRAIVSATVLLVMGSAAQAACTFCQIQLSIKSGSTPSDICVMNVATCIGKIGTFNLGTGVFTPNIPNATVTASMLAPGAAVGNISNGTITALMLASGAAVTNIGFTPISAALEGIANGIATLDSSGYVPTAQLPPAIAGGLAFQGSWNASTNSPALTSSVGSVGQYYFISVSGTTLLNGVNSWTVGDLVLFSSGIWNKIPGSGGGGAVSSVAGLTGVISGPSLMTALGAAPLASPVFTGTVTGSIAYTASGTGAVARTVSAKLGEGPSILDYGALCNGSTNDGPAIQAALNANAVVTVPQVGNSCVVNTTVTLNAGNALRFARGKGINYSSAATCFSTTANVDTIHLSTVGNTIDGLCFTHTGNSGGVIVDQGGSGSHTIKNNSISGTNDTNTNSLIYLKTSDNVVRGNNFGNSRPAGGYAVSLDAVGGVATLANRIEQNTFTALANPHAGKSVYVGSSDASARQEGPMVTNNQFVAQNTQITIEAVLSMHVDNNEIDQGWNNSIVLHPNSIVAVSDVHFTNNWISTPNQQSSGVCVSHDNTGGFPLGRIDFTANTFEFCGYGAAFNSSSGSLIFSANHFAAIQQAAILLNTDVGKTSIVGNTFDIGANFDLSINDSGAVVSGPFAIAGNNFDSTGLLNLTITRPTNWAWGLNTGLPIPALLKSVSAASVGISGGVACTGINAGTFTSNAQGVVTHC